MRNLPKIILAVTLLTMAAGCGVKIRYSFTGASISPDVKTISVQTFQNRASLVQPGLTQTLTDALIDMCKAQTNLNMVSSGGDVTFEGDITDYKTQPLTVSGSEQAAMNRFSITVRIKFINNIDPDLSYDQSFTRYQDYSSTLNLSDVEDSLTEEIVKMLVEDIFNRAFVNW
jgi:outer membrane lipopolysaccharide assembly protein LptE/RlpB